MSTDSRTSTFINKSNKPLNYLHPLNGGQKSTGENRKVLQTSLKLHTTHLGALGRNISFPLP